MNSSRISEVKEANRRRNKANKILYISKIDQIPLEFEKIIADHLNLNLCPNDDEETGREFILPSPEKNIASRFKKREELEEEKMEEEEDEEESVSEVEQTP